MRRLLGLVLLLATALPTQAHSAELDRPVPGGWWYSQTGSPGSLGFALVDDEIAQFWSEFQRLGGVPALGYPSSRRFRLDGFVVQATQRVLMQWRPETHSVAFVNVFDRLSELGHDRWLESARQTPRHDPSLGDVAARLTLLDESPAIKAAYYAAVGDPLAANGAPTSRVVDVGNHYALRAQRVVFQHWKESVPWAEAGQVTVALGGDIAKTLGLVPLPAQAAIAALGDGAVAEGPVEATTLLRTEPIEIDPAELLVRAGEAGPGARQIYDAPLDVSSVAQGRLDPAAYASRLEAAGFARGHRRGFLREAVVDPTPTGRYVLASDVLLFRTAEAARRFWQVDAAAGWHAREPAIRLDSVAIGPLADESVAFRAVSGDVASRGYLVLFRRANAIAFVSVLSQVSVPTLEESVGLARVLDERLRRAIR